MWGAAWVFKQPDEGGCWDAKGGQSFFDSLLIGDYCDR